MDFHIINFAVPHDSHAKRWRLLARRRPSLRHFRPCNRLDIRPAEVRRVHADRKSQKAYSSPEGVSCLVLLLISPMSEPQI
jgi:hypothetical protein